MNQFHAGGIGGMPTIVKNLLIINGLFFLAIIPCREFMFENFALFPVTSQYFEVWQFITHMFMHGGLLHLFLNMFVLFMFGSVLENIWGPKRFLNYYMFTGLGAALLHTIAMEYQISVSDPRDAAQLLMRPAVGASGAVFGLLLAFGIMFPNARILVFLIIPVKAKYLVIALALISLYLGFQNNPQDNIAHFAHLGGMVFGYILLRYWKYRS